MSIRKTALFAMVGVLSVVSASADMAALQPHEKMNLPKLPYAYNALEPYLSEQTLRIHHDKHHAKYVSNAKDLVAGTPLENEESMLSVLRSAAAGSQTGLFNNAAQSYNHAFYWECMGPASSAVRAPDGSKHRALMTLIKQRYGSYEAFRKEFAAAGMAVFGSGWVWLVHTPEGLEIVKTSNAGTPATTPGQTPLLAMDVWEHAYYLNYQNVRADYISAFLDHLVDWDFVNSQVPEGAGAPKDL